MQVRYDVGGALGLSQKIELVGLVVNALDDTSATQLTDAWSDTPAKNRFGTALFQDSPLQGELLLRVRN